MINTFEEFLRGTQATNIEGKKVRHICNWDYSLATELFFLHPRELWTLLPDEFVPAIGRVPLDVRKQILKDFIEFFPRDVFQECLREHNEESREYLAIIALRVFANTNKNANHHEQFAQSLKTGETVLLPIFQEWAKELRAMEKAAKDSLEWEAARERLKQLLNQTLPSVVEANVAFYGIAEDVVNLQAYNNFGRAQIALHIAAKLGDIDLVNNLLACNARFDAKDDRGNTALHSGVNHPSIVQMLLTQAEQKKQVEQFVQHASFEDRTALHLCRNAESAQLLLRACPSSVFAVNKWGKSALHLNTGNADVVKVLLNAAREEPGQLMRFVEQADKNGQTALHVCENVEIARLLVEASPKVASIECKAGCMPLHMHAPYGSEDSCRFLIEECGADVNAMNAAGQTPLHLACFVRQVETATLLLQKSAQVLARDAEQRTVLHYALMERERHAVVVTQSTHLPHYYHRSNVTTPMVKLLLRQEDKAVLNELIMARDIYEKTAFHYCAEQPMFNAEKADMLLMAGADGNAQGEEGDTALHILSRYHYSHVDIYLIKHWGLSVHVANYAGRTALDDVSDVSRRAEWKRISARAGIVTLRLAARPRKMQSPWKRLPRELFRELCSFLV